MKTEINYKVSVIVPIYNVADYLQDCLESLARQSYHNIEIILIDDGSSDDSGSICDDFFQKSNLDIIVKHNKNKGVSCTRNEAIECSRGDYIVFVDSDDVVSPYYIENLLGMILDTNSEIVVCEYTNNLRELVDKNNFNIGYKTKIIDQFEAFDQIIDNSNFGGYLWNKIFSNQIIKRNNIRFKDGIAIWEDMEFVAQYLNVISKVAIIEAKLYYYRQRENSAVATENLNKKYDKVKMAKVMSKSDYQKYTTFYRKITYMYFNSLFDYVWNASKSNALSKKEIKKILLSLKKNNCYKEISYKDKLKMFLMQLSSI